MVINDKNEVLWSLEFIQKYKDVWDWQGLSSKNNLPWSIEFIQLHKNKWDWAALSANYCLPWSIELIESFEYEWDWKVLTSNNSLPWSEELIIKFERQWDWNSLSKKSVNFWSIGLIKRFEDKWKWSELSSNRNIPWSIEIIDNFHSLWDWNNMSSNTSLPWSIEFITKYGKRWNLYYLMTAKGLPLSVEIIKHFEDKGNWDCLFLENNDDVDFNIKKFNEARYLKKRNQGNFWFWDDLSSKHGEFWSIELIKQFEEYWDWRELSLNKSLPWSKELIKQFDSKWEYSILSNKAINWSNELLEYRKNYSYSVAQNISLLSLLEIFEDNWFEIEWEIKPNKPNENNSWSESEDKICEEFIDYYYKIQTKRLKLQEWLELYNFNYLHKTARKITKEGYNRTKFKVTFKKWEYAFWKKISASNKLDFGFLNNYKYELDWNIIANNSSLNWSLKKIKIFENHIQMSSNLWSVFKPLLNSTLVNMLLQNAPKSNYIIENYSCQSSVFSVIKFGKHKEKTLYEIIKRDPSYINWCIINLEHFYIDDYTFKALKVFFPEFEFSPIAIKILKDKAEIIESKDRYNNKNYDVDYEKPETFKDWLDSEFGDDAGTAYWNLE